MMWECWALDAMSSHTLAWREAGLTKLGMHEHPVGENVYRVGLGIVHQRVPADALVSARDVVLDNQVSFTPAGFVTNIAEQHCGIRLGTAGAASHRRQKQTWVFLVLSGHNRRLQSFLPEADASQGPISSFQLSGRPCT